MKKENITRSLVSLLLLSLSLLLFIKCNNSEGFGGDAHIKGTLILKAYNDDFSELIYSKPAADEKVFLVFGDNEFVSDDINTDYNGNFRFSYLRPGNYKVFYYSLDSLLPFDQEQEILTEVKIENDLTYNLGEMDVLKTLDYNDGNASVTGRVFVINYLNSSSWPNLIVKDTAFAQEQEIYITYGKHNYYDDRIRTQYDGTFTFSQLIPGNYLIFLYSEDITGATQDIVIQREITIDSEFQEINLGDIYIEKL